MATTLVIKNANFSSNRLDKVDLKQVVPCTGITLSENSIAFTTYGQTAEVEYTLIPADSTDAVSIISNNEDIVTVDGNIITAVGVGQTTVMVTCGSVTATVNISSTMSMERYWKLGRQVGYDGDYNRAKETSVPNWGYCGAQQTWGNGRFISVTAEPYIPVYRIPKNTASLTINIPSTWNTILIFFDSTKTSEVTPRVGAYAITGEHNYQDSVAGTRTVVIPENADSVGIAYRTPADSFTSDSVTFLDDYPVVFNPIL